MMNQSTEQVEMKDIPIRAKSSTCATNWVNSLKGATLIPEDVTVDIDAAEQRTLNLQIRLPGT
jgi:hypothetical protein